MSSEDIVSLLNGRVKRIMGGELAMSSTERQTQPARMSHAVGPLGSELPGSKESGGKHQLRAALYCQSAKIGHTGNSGEQQLGGCRRYAEANGLFVVAEFFDAPPACDKDLPGMNGLCQLAGEGGIDIVVVEHIDLLPRYRCVTHDLHEEFTARGVRIHTVLDDEVP